MVPNRQDNLRPTSSLLIGFSMSKSNVTIGTLLISRLKIRGVLAGLLFVSLLIKMS